MIEAGTYRAVAIEAALGETSAQLPQVAVLFSLLDHPGEKITWYGSFKTEESEQRTIESLRLAGWRGNDLSDLSDLGANDTPEVNLVIAHEPDLAGRMRARVKWVNSIGGVAVKTRLEPDAAKAFAARMKARIAAYDAAKGGVPAPTPRPAPPQPAATQPNVGF